MELGVRLRSDERLIDLVGSRQQFGRALREQPLDLPQPVAITHFAGLLLPATASSVRNIRSSAGAQAGLAVDLQHRRPFCVVGLEPDDELAAVLGGMTELVSQVGDAALRPLSIWYSPSSSFANIRSSVRWHEPEASSR